jgi:hypothetical protein
MTESVLRPVCKKSGVDRVRTIPAGAGDSGIFDEMNATTISGSCPGRTTAGRNLVAQKIRVRERDENNCAFHLYAALMS